MKISGIYMIKNKIDNKIYIGSSKDIYYRFKTHKYVLNLNRHNPILQNSWNKYGEDNFEFLIVEECCIDDLITREQYWIDFYNCMAPNGFNVKEAGKYGRITDDVKRRISIALSGKNNTMYGVHRFGEDSPMYGKKHTDESRNIMSKRRKEIIRNNPKLIENMKGEKHPKVNLTLEDCKEILKLSNEGYNSRQLSFRFNVSINVINCIKAGVHWSNRELNANNY